MIYQFTKKTEMYPSFLGKLKIKQQNTPDLEMLVCFTLSVRLYFTMNEEEEEENKRWEAKLL